MTGDEFATKVKAKYPQYAGIDNAALTEKIIAKHPEYASQVEGRKSSSGQPIYPPQSEIGKGEAALEATKQALGTAVPGLEQTGKFLAEDAPGYIAEKTGASGSPLVRGAGVAAATALGTAGEMVPRKMGDVAAQALAGPVLEGAGALAKGAGKILAPYKALAGKVSTSLLARDIGVAEPFIENVKKNPAVLKDLSNDMQVVMDHAKSLGDIMKRGVDRLGSHISAIEDHFIETQIQNPGSLKKVTLDDISKKLGDIRFREGVEDGEHSPTDYGGKKTPGYKFNGFNEHGEPVMRDTPSVGMYGERIDRDAMNAPSHGVSAKKTNAFGAHGEPIYKEPERLSQIDAVTGSDAEKIRYYAGQVDKMKDGANAIDILRLKRQLKNDIAWSRGDEVAMKIGGRTNGILKNLYGDLQGKLDGLSPELRQANSEYSNARKQYDVLQKKVFGGSPEEAYNRVKLRIQRGVAPQALLERAAQINSGSEKAMRALIDRISAQQFSPYIRKGIAGGAMGVGAAAASAAALGGHGLYPLIADLAAAAASSPRLAALGIRGEAAASGALSKALTEGTALAGAHPATLRALGQAIANSHKVAP